MIHGEKKSSNHVSSKKYRGRGRRRSRYIAIQNFILFNVISLLTRYVAAFHLKSIGDGAEGGPGTSRYKILFYLM